MMVQNTAPEAGAVATLLWHIAMNSPGATMMGDWNTQLTGPVTTGVPTGADEFARDVVHNAMRLGAFVVGDVVNDVPSAVANETFVCP